MKYKILSERSGKGLVLPNKQISKLTGDLKKFCPTLYPIPLNHRQRSRLSPILYEDRYEKNLYVKESTKNR